jgi:hypothetical protein
MERGKEQQERTKQVKTGGISPTALIGLAKRIDIQLLLDVR